MSSIFNPRLFDPAFIKQKTESFKTAQPYKHIVMDDFLTEEFANVIHANFPSNDQLSRHYNGLNENKSEGADFAKFHPSYLELRSALQSPEVLKVLEQITGIDDLYSTQDSLGAGVHQGMNGSYLDVHIDFNIHYERNIHRRLNLLIFLNKNWKDEYGGKAEMWNADVTKCIQAYLPSFNRCVIFETNEISYHGYSRINIPENESRKSFYSYYYTDIKDYKGKYHDTVFKARPEEGAMKKIKTDVKETLKNNVKRVFKKLGIKI